MSAEISLGADKTSPSRCCFTLRNPMGSGDTDGKYGIHESSEFRVPTVPE